MYAVHGVRVDLPKWISHDEECDIDFVCVGEDVVAGRLDHLTVGNNYRAAIERFLLQHDQRRPYSSRIRLTSTSFSTSNTAVYASR